MPEAEECSGEDESSPFDTTMSLRRANVLALAAAPLAAVPVLVHAALWGWGSFRADWGLLGLLFLPAVVVAIIVHEGLHALGFLCFGRVPPSALHWGIDRATLSPYAGCRIPVRAWAYRGSALLPALVLGVAPLVVGLATGLGWLTVWASWMLLASGGDFLALWAMRRVPARALVLDHPERVGCRVVDAPRGAAPGVVDSAAVGPL